MLSRYYFGNVPKLLIKLMFAQQNSDTSGGRSFSATLRMVSWSGYDELMTNFPHFATLPTIPHFSMYFPCICYPARL
jgi:hypothetical protein